MPKNITGEADLSLFPMTSCITGISDEDGYIREVVTARQIIDASDMFSNLGALGIKSVLVKFGFTAVGPVCEILEQSAEDTNSVESSGSGVYVETVHDSVATMYRLQSEGLEAIGLGRLNFANPDELAAADSLFTSRTKRMGGSPIQVAYFIFNNIPSEDMAYFDHPE